MPADKVTLHLWLDILEQQADERSGICKRLLINAKQMQTWHQTQAMLADVLVELYAQEDFQLGDEEQEARVLSDEKIRSLWLALEHSRMALKNKLFLELCLFFTRRSGERHRAKKADFAFWRMVGTVPRDHKVRKKGGRPIFDDSRGRCLSKYLRSAQQRVRADERDRDSRWVKVRRWLYRTTAHHAAAVRHPTRSDRRHPGSLYSAGDCSQGVGITLGDD